MEMENVKMENVGKIENIENIENVENVKTENINIENINTNETINTNTNENANTNKIDEKTIKKIKKRIDMIVKKINKGIRKLENECTIDIETEIEDREYIYDDEENIECIFKYSVVFDVADSMHATFFVLDTGEIIEEDGYGDTDSTNYYEWETEKDIISEILGAVESFIDNLCVADFRFLDDFNELIPIARVNMYGEYYELYLHIVEKWGKARYERIKVEWLTDEDGDEYNRCTPIRNGKEIKSRVFYFYPERRY